MIIKETKNTFRVHWLWSVFVLFRLIIKKSISNAFLLYQANPCFGMELDSEIQASKDKIQKEKGIRVHR
jgi:hypothetical protein